MAADLFDTTPPDSEPVTKGRKLRRFAFPDHARDELYWSAEQVLDLKPSYRGAHAQAMMTGMGEALRLRGVMGDIERPNEQALYVVGEAGSPINKIGITYWPTTRLRSLEGTCGAPLKLKALLWVYGSAFRLEQTVHRVCEKAGARLKGEWFLLPPETCCEAIIATAGEICVECADSATMAANWKRRAIAFADRKQARLEAFTPACAAPTLMQSDYTADRVKRARGGASSPI